MASFKTCRRDFPLRSGSPTLLWNPLGRSPHPLSCGCCCLQGLFGSSASHTLSLAASQGWPQGPDYATSTTSQPSQAGWGFTPNQRTPPRPPNPTFCCQEKLVTKTKQLAGGAEGKKSCARVTCPFPALIPFEVQAVAPARDRGPRRSQGREGSLRLPLPNAGKAREATEVSQSSPGTPRSRRSPHPRPAEAAAPKCFLSALKQNPEGASFLPTSLRWALRAGRRLAEMNGPRLGWERRPLPHPRSD